MIFGGKKSFWEQEDKVNELIAAYKAATNDDERDAVLDKYSKSYTVDKSAIRAKLFMGGVLIARARSSTSKSSTERTQKNQPESNTKAAADSDARHISQDNLNISYGAIDDYTVVNGKTSAELVQNVKEKMSYGWQPFGAVGADAFGISPVGGNQYIQAMVKYRDRS